jgi:hypothetical protein
MSQANSSRTRHSRVQWQTWIDEQAKSGLSEAVFCEQNGISLKRLQDQWGQTRLITIIVLYLFHGTSTQI